MQHDPKKISRINYRALSLEGTFYNAGLAFLDANAVLPVFIYAYTQSLQLTGLATTLAMGVPILTQILLGQYLNGINKLPRFIARQMLLMRPMILLTVPVMLSGLSATWVLSTFFAAYTLVFVGQGLVTIPWMKLLGQTVETDQRNRVFGNQQLLGGLAALAAGSAVKLILNQAGWTDGLKFAVIFSCSGVVMLLTGLTMLFAHDLPASPSRQVAIDRHFYQGLPGFIQQNPQLKKLIVVRAISTFASLITPLLILFGRSQFNLSSTHVSTLILIQITGSLTGGLVWRTLSSRYGNLISIRVSQIIALGIALIALLLTMVPSNIYTMSLLGLLILLNGINMGSWSGFANYTFDISNDSNRSAYILAVNVVLFPLTFVSLAGGLLAASFGFLPLFLVCGLTALLGIWLSSHMSQPK